VNSNGKCQNKAFGGINNSAFITSPERQFFSFNDCIVGNATSADGENFGFETASDGVFKSCIVQGQAGDDFGIHKCSRILIDGCIMQSYNGRYYISDSDSVRLTNSTLNYVAATEGMGIYVGSESTANPHVCQNIIIQNNIVNYGTGAVASNYGIRIISGRDVLVSGNRLIKNNSVSVANIWVENHTLIGWVDPTGIDPNDNPQSHRVKVEGNIIDGIISIVGGDYVTVIDNLAASYNIQSAGSVERFDSNIYTSGLITDNIFDASGSRMAAKLISKYIVSNTGSGYTDGLDYPSIGSADHYVQKDCAVLFIVVRTTSAISSGFYQIRLMLNGVQTGSTRTFSGTNPVNFITSSSSKTYFFERGDTMGITAKTNNGSPTPNDIVVEVYGVEL